ncbi:MAG: hypothetical protein GVY22_04355 [Gammaproteobacteria bacterium]|nr:hypothetical protein [Gammaproteobacteria bacterium]
MSGHSLNDLSAGVNVPAVRIGRGRTRRRRPLLRLAVAAGWLGVLGGTFALGYALARHDAAEALVGMQALRAEVAFLSEEVARGRAERIRLERAHQMDREAKRQAQQSLAEMQRERLLLSKRVAYLQRLVRGGDTGVVEVKDLQLTQLEAPGTYRFEIVLSQLVPQAGRTQGMARLRLGLTRSGARETMRLGALPGSSPGTVALDFEHFQIVRGEIVLPADATAEEFIVDIEPEGERLASSSDAFLWPAALKEKTVSPSPVVATADLVGATEVE